MNPPPRKIEWTVWAGMVATLVLIAAAFLLSRGRLDRAATRVPVLFALPDFTLTNQLGQPVSLADLRGHVWLADIVFTRCAGPCPAMTGKMAELQKAFPAAAPLRFVTLTTDPEFDTPPVLAAFGHRYGAHSNRWHFLTGTKQQIGALAIDGLKLVVTEKKQAERENDRDLFVHSTIFVLVDTQGRVRGYIGEDGSLSGGFESDDPALKLKVTDAVNALLREK